MERAMGFETDDSQYWCPFQDFIGPVSDRRIYQEANVTRPPTAL
jgi:hypothetical protein